MVKSRDIGYGWIIHIFALMHASVALLCRLWGVGDEIVLTLLTMTMALLLCFRRNVSVEFFAISILIVNIIGYALGTFGANLLSKLLPSLLAVHELSTFLTTEVLGWSIAWLGGFFRKTDSRNSLTYLRWIIIAACVILLARLVIVNMFSLHSITAIMMLEMIRRFFSNSVALLMLVCADVVYVHYMAKLGRSIPSALNMLLIAAFICAMACFTAVTVGMDFPTRVDGHIEGEFFLLFTVSLLVHIVTFSIVYMVQFAQTSRAQMQKAREKASLAQYSYLKLKRQLNPHFLFNSLNILDCLVCEEKTEHASTYIHKLAGIYRYMLKSEDLELVPLSDELVFVGLYVDLLKVRFPEGFDVQVDVSDEAKRRMVLPCALQLLVENATKHNAVGVHDPLLVKISSDGQSVRVCNNINPKVTMSPSTGLGHKYLNERYMNLCGKGVEICGEGGEYTVVLPLL